MSSESHASHYSDFSSWSRSLSYSDVTDVNGKSRYKCRLCPVEYFKPSLLRKLHSHLQLSHDKRAVAFQGLKIAPCYQPCHSLKVRTHYHCPCGVVIVRRSRFEDHLTSKWHAPKIVVNIQPPKKNTGEVGAVPQLGEPVTSSQVEEPWTSSSVEEPSTLPQVEEPNPLHQVEEPSTSSCVKEPSTSSCVEEPSTSSCVEEPSTSSGVEEPNPHLSHYSDTSSWIRSLSDSQITDMHGKSKYKCPLCPLEYFRPSTLLKLRSHLQLSHDKQAVAFQGLKIAPCYQPCHSLKSRVHYHCPCGVVIVRRLRFQDHLLSKWHCSRLHVHVEPPETTTGEVGAVPQLGEPGTSSQAGEPSTSSWVEEPSTSSWVEEPNPLPQVEEPNTWAEDGKPRPLPQVEELNTWAEDAEPNPLLQVEEPIIWAEVGEPSPLPQNSVYSDHEYGIPSKVHILDGTTPKDTVSSMDKKLRCSICKKLISRRNIRRHEREVHKNSARPPERKNVVVIGPQKGPITIYIQNFKGLQNIAK